MSMRSLLKKRVVESSCLIYLKSPDRSRLLKSCQPIRWGAAIGHSCQSTRRAPITSPLSNIIEPLAPDGTSASAATGQVCSAKQLESSIFSSGDRPQATQLRARALPLGVIFTMEPFMTPRLSFMMITTALLGVSTLAFPGVSRADGKTDFQYQLAQQRYFDLPLSARNLALAGTTVATSQDSSNIFGNPAGLGMMTGAEISTTYGRDYVSGRDLTSEDGIQQDLDQGYAAGAFPLGPTLDELPRFGNIGLGWSGYSSKIDDTVDTDTDGYRIHAAYAKALNPDISVGYSFALVQNSQESRTIDYEMDSGYRHALGVQYQPTDSVVIGSTAFVGHARPDLLLRESNASDDYRQIGYGADLGIQYMPGESTLLAARFDWEHYHAHGDIDIPDVLQSYDTDERANSYIIRIGVEQELLAGIIGRLGYRYLANDDFSFGYDPSLNGSAKSNAVSFGLGVNLFDAARLDYGAEYREIADGDWSHYVTLTIPFSLCREDYERKTRKS